MCQQGNIKKSHYERFLYNITERGDFMKRQIIKINDDKCNGCGLCIPDCPEGALQLIDGKARLISDLFCDGLGACISGCPEGAIEIEERDAEPYDEAKVMENIVKQGVNVLKAHLQHLHEHGQHTYLDIAVSYCTAHGIPIPDYKQEAVPCHGAAHGGCPGSQPMVFAPKASSSRNIGIETESELRQWPVQLKLLNPAAPFFHNADLLISADCSPVAFADFHSRFLKDKTVILFCPKLDPYIDEYVDKLTAIISMHEIKSITIVRMEVPCCGGINAVVGQALSRSGKNIVVKEYTISLQGDIK